MVAHRNPVGGSRVKGQQRGGEELLKPYHVNSVYPVIKISKVSRYQSTCISDRTFNSLYDVFSEAPESNHKDLCHIRHLVKLVALN